MNGDLLSIMLSPIAPDVWKLLIYLWVAPRSTVAERYGNCSFKFEAAEAIDEMELIFSNGSNNYWLFC